ncbi:aldolase/citrate lyase family protein [Deinococcus frigens]
MAHAGWDALTLDLQHGPFDYAEAFAMIQAVQTTLVHVVTRVPQGDLALATKFLDAGVEGMILPMVESREECEAFVAACRYPPLGTRSYGPTRAAVYHGPTYAARANDFVVTMPMIETRQALEHLDDIAAVPGVDALFVGPGDLGLSLYGEPRLDSADPEFLTILRQIVETGRRHGVAAGIFVTAPAYAVKMFQLGFAFVTVSSDARLLVAAASATTTQVHDGLKEMV